MQNPLLKYNREIEGHFDLSNEKKVDVLIAIMHDLRNHIHNAEKSSFQIMTWSSGILFAIVGYWIIKIGEHPPINKIWIIAMILVFGLFIQLLLLNTQKDDEHNWFCLNRAERALKLLSKDTYIKGEIFYISIEESKYLPSRSNIYYFLNLMIVSFVVIVVIFV